MQDSSKFPLHRELGIILFNYELYTAVFSPHEFFCNGKMHCPAEQVAFSDDLNSYAFFPAARHLQEDRITCLAWLLC